jgi:hypothetical protein
VDARPKAWHDGVGGRATREMNRTAAALALA